MPPNLFRKLTKLLVGRIIFVSLQDKPILISSGRVLEVVKVVNSNPVLSVTGKNW